VRDDLAQKPANPPRTAGILAERTRNAAPVAEATSSGASDPVRLIIIATIGIGVLLVAVGSIPARLVPSRVAPAHRDHHVDCMVAGGVLLATILTAMLLTWRP
jgi:hypothetical protein